MRAQFILSEGRGPGRPHRRVTELGPEARVEVWQLDQVEGVMAEAPVRLRRA